MSGIWIFCLIIVVFVVIAGVIIISRKHKHDFIYDLNESSATPVGDGYYAKYHEVYKCKCGEKKEHNITSFL